VATIYKPSLLYLGFLTLPFLQLCFLQPPTAADDDDFLDFSHDDIFHQQIRSLIYKDDDRALRGFNYDVTVAV